MTRSKHRLPALVAVAAILVAPPDGGSGASAQGAGTRANRLINEKSPYLQLHAQNPVDWYPWATEAFEKARGENKPIFLSIGYSTCHWCHVMEEESFSDPSIAQLLNRSFISIKVDREERPDVDRIYTAYVLWYYGGAGWPLSVMLTPDLKPFAGATYLPAEDRDGRQGFRSWLTQMSAMWESDADRRKLIAAADTGTKMIELQLAAPATAASMEIARALDQIYQDIESSFDPVEGGFGTAPKFPRPVLLNFLLRYHDRTGTRRALEMAVHTLGAMARGGIHDHIGGGFHRYATDREWHVPHFEKMLYDQAQLAIAFIEAHQVTKNPALAAVARDTLDYVLRDMRSPEGGFFSAVDADSAPAAGEEPAEGAFYTWSAGELRAALGAELSEVFAFHYGAEPDGNVPPKLDVQGELKGKNVLIVRHSTEQTAAKFRKSEEDIQALLASARQRLADIRAGRPRPALDDKVLVAWNGMMLSAFARAAQAFDDPRYLDAAVAAAQFIERRMYDSRGNVLKRRYRQGESGIAGMLEDYVFLVQGLVDLYEASFDTKWLSWALRLQARQDQLFWDGKRGAYFSTEARASDVLVRVKEEYDGAEPSANSVAAMNLLRLWQMTDRREWRERADAIFKAQAGPLMRSGAMVPQLAAAVGFSLSKPKQIVIAGEAGADDTRAMLQLVHERFIPNKIVVLADGGPGQSQIARWLPFIKSMDRRDGKATMYLCEDYACKLPTSDLQTAADLLDESRR
jgi:uncharacterized protein YyaL (SSP411 family)